MALPEKNGMAVWAYGYLTRLCKQTPDNAQSQNRIEMHGCTQNGLWVGRQCPDGMVESCQILIRSPHFTSQAPAASCYRWPRKAAHWKRLHALCSHFPCVSLYPWVKGNPQAAAASQGSKKGEKASPLPIPPHPHGTWQAIILWLWVPVRA